MRIFVSSSFQDLQEYRMTAIRVLRQLGHEVVAMEDFVAASEVPLKQMLDKVERCELYVGLFAWRYGFVPNVATRTTPPMTDNTVPGAFVGVTSITHYEYLHAKAKNIDRLAFLLDERVAWPPHLIDGFSTVELSARNDTSAIRALRGELQLNAVVSYFTNPNDLEARVSAAVTVAGMSRQVRLNLAGVGEAVNDIADSSTEIGAGIRKTIQGAGIQRALKIKIQTTWWSTRLYLTSALAERLTQVRRIVIVSDEKFVGLLSTQRILTTLAASNSILAAVAKKLQQRRNILPDAESEMNEVFALWRSAFGGDNARSNEEGAKVVLTVDILRRWFGDAMLQQPVNVPDLARASVVDLLRILDYPSEFVPVVLTGPAERLDSFDRIKVVDKAALNAQLAQSYITELMDRARIA